MFYLKYIYKYFIEYFYNIFKNILTVNWFKCKYIGYIIVHVHLSLLARLYTFQKQISHSFLQRFIHLLHDLKA